MPRKAVTITDYARRIDRVMAWLAATPARPLGQTPGLDEMAAVAAFSPCHFHRIYRLLAGETPAETLLRARLSRAARTLAASDVPIVTIARRAGYRSQAAFSRAFAAGHGLPPAAYRVRGGIGQTLRQSATEEMKMVDVAIHSLPPLWLAAMRHKGPYMGISGVFDRLGAWAAGKGLVDDQTRFFGLYWDDPGTVAEADLRSAAALTVPPGTQADDGVEIMQTPAFRVAALRFKGPYAELEGAYNALYRDWLPRSGEEPAAAPPMEEYLNDCRRLPPTEWLTDVLLPLKPR